jgi:5'-3' exonuclease
VKHLIFDTHHLLHRTFFTIGEDMDAETMSAMGLHKALMSMNKFYKQFMPDNVVCVFDNYSWRKDYTASDKCLSIKKYKANRRKDLTEKQVAQFKIFDDHIEYFKSILKDLGTMDDIVTLSGPGFPSTKSSVYDVPFLSVQPPLKRIN